MFSLMRRLFLAFLRKNAMESGRFVGLYRRLCNPSGQEWASYLKHRGFFYAMGEDCVIQANVDITDPKHVRLGNNVHLTGCTIFGHEGTVSLLKKMTGLSLDSVGKVDILDNVFIGHCAIIMPNVTIGPNAIVAAGAVVTRDVLPNTIVGGIPAKQIGTLDDYLQRMKERTAALPWFGHPLIAGDYFGPASDELTKIRCDYFFKTPQASAETQAVQDDSAE
jgi:acetyltransferase-like isoleucine patch superfamily enzyme